VGEIGRADLGGSTSAVRHARQTQDTLTRQQSTFLHAASAQSPSSFLFTVLNLTYFVAALSGCDLTRGRTIGVARMCGTKTERPNLASTIAQNREQRRLIGDPKFGLILRINQVPNALRLSARPDPLLLYIVLGTAVAVGIVGSIASSFAVSGLGFLVLALLFSPMILLLALQNLRIRTTCVLDRDRAVIEIDEQSYTRRVRESYPLREVESIAVRILPDGPLLGTAFSFGLFIVMGNVEYLAACSNNEVTLSQDAWRLSRFLGTPLETPLGQARVQRRHVPVGLFLVSSAIYLVPTFLAIAALILLFEQVPNVEPSLLALLGAIMVSQIGAILAFAYFRARRPFEP
jgi:hypothetical protein